MTNASVPLAGLPLEPVFPTGRAAGTPPGAATPERLAMGPLQQRLFFIVLVGLLPLALLACATLLYNAREQRREILRATDDTAVAILVAVDTELALALASLNALAISPRLAHNEWPAFHAEARRMLEQHPGWANVILSTPAAEQVVNARLPYGSRLPSRVAPDAVATTARTGRSQVGNLVFGPALHEYAFAVHAPVMREATVSHVLSAPIRPAVMEEILARQAITEPSVAVILDATQTVVARSRRPEETIGSPASPDLAQLVRNGRSGTGSITRTLEGGSVYTLFRRSETTGWSVAIGIPTAALDAPVVRSYIAMGASLALSVVLGLLAALIAARSIVRPMRELEAAARALAQGRKPTEPRTSLPEVRQVGRALVQAQVERERLLESERDARRVAENASRAKDEFLAMLGHELRNPLAAISTAAQILERMDDDHNAVAADARAIIGRQARNLARMTDDLLDAGRVMLGKIELKCEPLDLAALVESVVDTFHSTGRLVDRRATISLAPAWVDGDATRLEQVVSNLLSNAIKFTSPGDAIAVDVRREGSEATVEVSDEGTGISADLLPMVFDLFVQGPQPVERGAGGLGIGLALARRLVDLHGGRIAGHSDGSERGSRFTVQLPAIDAPVAAPVPGPRVHPARRIVIVEDNDDARTSLQVLLVLAGHEVHAAADGVTGLAAILREHPDVALVDIGLPGMDGRTLAREVRARLQGGIRMIAMTGYGQPEEAEGGMAAGFDRYLVKPVDPEVLAEMLLV